MNDESSQLYQQLKEEIRLDELALMKKKAFAEFLHSRMTGAEEVAQVHAKPTIKSHVENAVLNMEAGDFNATMIHEWLGAAGVQPMPPKIRVSTVLGRMTEVGRLLLVEKGYGGRPNWYRVSER